MTDPAAATPQPERDLFGRTPKGRKDWSHRRGEPRVLVLCWSLYLLATLILAFAPTARSMSVTPAMFQEASRLLALLWMLGLVLLAPAFRLSQVASPRPVLAAARDWFLLLTPIAGLSLVQVWSTLSDWPLSVVLAEIAAFAAWGAVAFGVVALVPAVGGGPIARGLAALVLAGLGAGVPLALVLSGRITLDPTGDLARGVNGPWMASPLTAVWELMRERDWTGRPAAVFRGHWRALWLTAVAAATPWLVAIAAAVVRGRRRDDA